MGSTGIVTVIGALVGAGLLGVVFYVSSLARNVYAIKVRMKEDLAYEVEKMQHFLDKEMARRQKWIMRDVEDLAAGDGGAAEEVQVLRKEVQGEIAGLKDKVRKLAALQQALAAKQTKVKPQAVPEPAMEPVFKANGPGKTATG